MSYFWGYLVIVGPRVFSAHCVLWFDWLRWGCGGRSFDCDPGWAIRMLGCWCGLTALESTVIVAYRKADGVDAPLSPLRRTAPHTTKACARRDKSCSYTSKLRARSSGSSGTLLYCFYSICLQLPSLTGATIAYNYSSSFLSRSLLLLSLSQTSPSWISWVQRGKPCWKWEVCDALNRSGENIWINEVTFCAPPLLPYMHANFPFVHP